MSYDFRYAIWNRNDTSAYYLNILKKEMKEIADYVNSLNHRLEQNPNDNNARMKIDDAQKNNTELQTEFDRIMNNPDKYSKIINYYNSHKE